MEMGSDPRTCPRSNGLSAPSLPLLQPHRPESLEEPLHQHEKLQEPPPEQEQNDQLCDEGLHAAHYRSASLSLRPGRVAVYPDLESAICNERTRDTLSLI